ncbi:hypothetical protein N7922_24905 (plasmid) [Kosakonia sp. ML.JS2a]|uniref:hypothetical protein n=1 Tax=Kosakonia sp. ML.JS2a TaxID=2980557 RepID=UPI0021D8DB46|nr:hypothetical protein [Kosakonia sp. ML.JS2a]UXY13591.1 hypothetical protein N7922_24905 [Kosakonia sp. ML.JS2a]
MSRLPVWLLLHKNRIPCISTPENSKQTVSICNKTAKYCINPLGKVRMKTAPAARGVPHSRAAAGC